MKCHLCAFGLLFARARVNNSKKKNISSNRRHRIENETKKRRTRETKQ